MQKKKKKKEVDKSISRKYLRITSFFLLVLITLSIFMPTHKKMIKRC